MDEEERGVLNLKAALLTTAGVGLMCLVARYRTRLLKTFGFFRNNPLNSKKIKIVETPDECLEIVNTLKKHCIDFKVLGFDCEWVEVGGKRRPVALLQLSSQKGLCALFRLSNIQQIPKSLRDLLEDDDVVKVGVATVEDAHKLAYDYGVGVASTLDLRFVAALAGEKPEGLAKMAKSLLNVQLDKHWRLSCSNWEAKALSEKQLEYAANDAFVAVKIFEALLKPLKLSVYRDLFKTHIGGSGRCLEEFFDTRFKEGYFRSLLAQGQIKFGSSVNKKDTKIKYTQSRKIYTRSKVLYHNCLLEAPDGELLCTIDSKKAQWYMNHDLGKKIKDDPLTVRLNFQPSSRAESEACRYYLTTKENQCVVCGRRDVYIRKMIIPREYRKHFPVVMKSHVSHDILLFCPECHQLSSIFDLRLRQELAEMCDAPLINADACVEVAQLKHLKSSAKALLQMRQQLPADRCKELEKEVSEYYGVEILTEDLIENAANIGNATYSQVYQNYCQHGEKVVRKFENELGGLVKLEKLWRQHFLDTMKPKFLPDLWSVNHNENRLEKRALEGRVQKDDLKIAGLGVPQNIDPTSENLAID